MYDLLNFNNYFLSTGPSKQYDTQLAVKIRSKNTKQNIS